MPTAAKLIAALCLALVAYAASDRVALVSTREIDFTVFKIVNTVLGAIVGWRVTGRHVDGGGLGRGAGSGLLAITVLVFWALFGYSVREMLIRATHMRYDDPPEALDAVVALALDYGRTMLDIPLIAILTAGGLGTGLAAQMAARRWR